MLKNKTVVIIISLVCAILLWAYVVGEVDPKTSGRVTDVPISIVDQDSLTEEGLAVIPDDDMTVGVVVIKGNRSRVNKVKKAGLTAYVDVSECREGENECEINVNTPDGITIDRMSDEIQEVTVENIAENEKTVEIGFSENGEDEADKTPWILYMEYDNVNVSGAESVVKKVSAVKGTIDPASVKDEEAEWVDVPVTAVDADGEEVKDVSLDLDSVRVQAALLSVKSVKLKVSAENVKEGYKVKEIESREKVKIVGSADALSEIKKVDGVADLSDETASGDVKAELDLPYGVYLYNKSGYDEGSETVVTVTLKKEK